MHEGPLVLSRDRFSTALPGRRIQLSDSVPTELRPFCMGLARVPREVAPSTGKHEKPTENKVVTDPTTIYNDGKTEKDTETKTITD